MYEYLIVGAAFSRAVLAERIATQLDKKVIIVDKHQHIGGNAYDYFNEEGILKHKYGPHRFHTNEKGVFDYLSAFTQWRFHFHRVKTYVDGLLLPILINMDTLNDLYGLNLSAPEELQEYFNKVKVHIPS